MKRLLGCLAALLLLSVLLCPGTARAEEGGKGYAEYEYDFGIKLIRFGFWGLAEKHFNDYLKDPKIPADRRSKAYLGLSELFKARGSNPSASAKEREEAFRKSLQNLNEFLAKWPDKKSPDYRQAEVQKHGIAIDRIQASIREISEMEEGDAQKALQEKCATELKTMLASLNEIHNEINDEMQNYMDEWYKEHPDAEYDPQVPDEMMDRWARIGEVLARVYELYPTIYVSGTEQHKKALDFSLQGFEEFLFMHSEDSIYIVGGIATAKILAAKIQYAKDPADKEDLRLKVISTFEDFVFCFEADVFPFLQEMAFNELADILSNLGDKEAILSRVWNAYTEKYPNWLDETYYGQGYLLASKVSIAMLENNRASEAVELLTNVIAKANYRGIGAAAAFASKQLATIIEQLGPESMDIKILLQAGQGFKGKGDWVNAISYYQHVIQRLDESFDEEYLAKTLELDRNEIKARKEKFDLIQKEKTDIAIRALAEISDCFVQLGMDMEAVVAANDAVGNYHSKVSRAKDPEECNKLLLMAALNSYNSARKLFYQSVKDESTSKVISTLYNQALQNYVKMKPERKGYAAYEMGQLHNASSQYLEAIKAYKDVPESESKYADAQYNICVCYSKLSSDAKEAGKQEEADKYRVQAIDSLKAVIKMQRTWSVTDTKKKSAWLKKKSMCYVLLSSIYETQSMLQELAELAPSWKAEFADLVAKDIEYIQAAVKLYERSIKAAISLKDMAKAESVLYKELKDLVLGTNPKEIKENQKYKVDEEVGALMVPICESIAAAFAAANNDPDKLKYYQLEGDKWQGGTKTIAELYEDFKKREKSPELQLAAAKKLITEISKDMVLNPFDSKSASAKYKEVSKKAYLDTIYFAGNSKKTNDMKELYKQFLSFFYGYKERLNYYKALKLWDELKKMDPEKTLEIWTKPGIPAISKELQHQIYRLQVYNKMAKDSRYVKYADSTSNVDVFKYICKVYSFLVNYYGNSKEEYIKDYAYVLSMAGDYDESSRQYAVLLQRSRSDLEKNANLRIALAKNYIRAAQSYGADPEAAKDIKELYERAESHLKFVRVSVAAAWEKHPEWAELLKNVETELGKLK